MKKGKLALTVLSCLLLVGAPACNSRKNSSSPPSNKVEPPKKTQKKSVAPKKKVATDVKKQPGEHKKK